jgi:hypothetical protein
MRKKLIKMHEILVQHLQTCHIMINLDPLGEKKPLNRLMWKFTIDLRKDPSGKGK